MKIEGKLVKQVDSFVYIYRNTVCNDGGDRRWMVCIYETSI